MQATKQSQNRGGDGVDFLSFTIFASEVIFVKGTLQLNLILRQRSHVRLSVLCYAGSQTAVMILFWS